MAQPSREPLYELVAQLREHIGQLEPVDRPNHHHVVRLSSVVGFSEISTSYTD